MECDELIKQVRIVVNETGNDDDVSLLSVDTRSFDENIKSLLPKAVSFVQHNKAVASKRVNVKSVLPVLLTPQVDSSGGAYIAFPPDFAALYAVKLDGWEVPVDTILPLGSSEAKRQFCKYTRAGCCKPVCVESARPLGNGGMLLFPLPGGENPSLSMFLYEAVYNPDEQLYGTDEDMVIAIVYECAALLYTMFERYDAANSCHALAMAACGAK